MVEKEKPVVVTKEVVKEVIVEKPVVVEKVVTIEKVVEVPVAAPSGPKHITFDTDWGPSGPRAEVIKRAMVLYNEMHPKSTLTCGLTPAASRPRVARCSRGRRC